jgi:hypothetical protein
LNLSSFIHSLSSLPSLSLPFLSHFVMKLSLISQFSIQSVCLSFVSLSQVSVQHWWINWCCGYKFVMNFMRNAKSQGA